ncbi:hypothetical protein [Salipiger sp.]|uniref:hypothetical protein n=1 Tax=Salipiger sp. TaxID=2078585 RepID=UPI003A96C469
MRWLSVILCLWGHLAVAQSRDVLPSELGLEVVVANDTTPYAREMVIVTIKGTYRRHITRETLEQPSLEGFNWMQLGTDDWHEETIRGRPVKVFQRRMALFPEHEGEITIGPFVHHLTLTDEGDDWFAHDISSEPVTIRVDPAPVAEGDGWWFPVRQLRIQDSWSNAPDQLTPGEGVLRVIHIEAVGASPQMIPPMPELTSPSAMIFPHPEKRLVELSPEGPVTHAFWRWTVRPTNDTSAILEPISFDFFDTRERVARTVTISPQRVAFETATLPPVDGRSRPPGYALSGWSPFLALLAGLCGGLAWMLVGRRVDLSRALARHPMLDPLAWRLRSAGRHGDLPGWRRAALSMIRRDGAGPQRRRLLAALDRAVFAPGSPALDLRGMAREFLSARHESKSAADTNG